MERSAEQRLIKNLQWNNFNLLHYFCFLRNSYKTYCSAVSVWVRKSIVRKMRAGLPATITSGGTSLVTTLPAPIMAFSPIVTLLKIVQLEPMEAPLLTSIGSTFQSFSVWRAPFPLVARGYVSLMKTTLWPIKTLSSIVTPSQIKVWLDILQFFRQLCGLASQSGLRFQRLLLFASVLKPHGPLVALPVVVGFDSGVLFFSSIFFWRAKENGHTTRELQ